MSRKFDPADYPYIFRAHDRRHVRGGQACRIWSGGPPARQESVIVQFPDGGLRLGRSSDLDPGSGRFLNRPEE